MGKPRGSNPKPPPGIYRDEPDRDDAASTSSAMSLHEGIDFDDSHEALPPYTDDLESDMIARSEAERPHQLSRGWDAANSAQSIRCTNQCGGIVTYLSTELSSDASLLQDFVKAQSARRPGVWIHIHGEHTETRREGKGNKETKETVVDFDIKVDATDTITREDVQSYTQIMPNNDKTYRGTLSKTKSQHKTADPENVQPQISVEQWCQLFCASHSKLKSFTIYQRILDRNELLLERLIESAIRDTNYRGRIQITFQLDPHTVTVQTPHFLNQMRHNRWVYWLCIILQLWLITWPLLFFMTKRWALLYISWPYRKSAAPTEDDIRRGQMPVIPVKESEEAWVQRWRYSIQQGVLSRAVAGKALSFIPQAARETEEQRMREEAEARAAEPQNGFIGGALALARGVSNIARENNRIMGWGNDS